MATVLELAGVANRSDDRCCGQGADSVNGTDPLAMNFLTGVTTVDPLLDSSKVLEKLDNQTPAVPRKLLLPRH